MRSPNEPSVSSSVNVPSARTSRRLRSAVTCLFLLAGAPLLACSSSDDDADGNGPHTEAPATTPVNELGSADIAALCDWYVGGIDYSGMCQYMAVASTSEDGAGQAPTTLVAQCDSEAQSCAAQTNSTLDAARTACNTDWLAGSDCTATLDELVTCFQGLMQTRNARFTSVSCQSTDLTQPLPEPDTSAMFASCGAVIQKCRTLFSSDTSTDDPTANDPAITVACKEQCVRFASECPGAEDCSSSCSSLRSVYGEVCDPLGERFYACLATDTLDCSASSPTLASSSCTQELADYITCYALGGITCGREPSWDEYCTDAAHPYGKRCVSDAVPADCVRSSLNYYCCATE